MRLQVSGIAILFSLLSQAQTPRINFTAPMLYPEGVAYNSSNQLFYVSSVKTGTIGTVDRMGHYKEWYKDDALKSSFGLKIDQKRNWLWACTGDPNYSMFSDSDTYKKMIRLVAIDLASGKKVKDINLSDIFPGKHFANDMTMDPENNIYVTDSYAPVIYKIDADGRGSVFAKSDLFKSTDVGLNGIVYHPSGYLITVHNSDGILYRINVKAPTQITAVRTMQFFPGGDGLMLNASNELILVQNKGIDKAFKLVSTDNWLSAEIIAATGGTDRFQYPTTIATADGKLYLLNAKLDELQDATKQPSKEFSLQLAEFKSVK